MSTKGRAPVLIRALLIGIAATMVGLDQFTKTVARSTFEEGSVSVIPGWLDLSLSSNSGGAFGILPGGRVLFLVALTILLVGLVVGINRIRSCPRAIGFGLLAGGAIGNGLDRLRNEGGYVTDFIRFKWWPTFNVADIGIVVGTFMIALTIWRRRSADESGDDELETARS